MKTVKRRIVELVRYSYLLLIVLLFLGCEKRTESYDIEKEPFVSSSYSFGIYQYRNTKESVALYSNIVNYLESKIAGVTFVLEPSNDSAHFEEKMINQSVDFMFLNPYQIVTVLDLNYTIVAKTTSDRVFYGLFVARKDSPIRDIEDLKGKIVGFPTETAFAGTLMTKWYLYRQGLDPERDIRSIYAGSQVGSILTAYQGKADVACTWGSPWNDWVRDNPEEASEMKVLWETDRCLSGGLVAHKRVPKEVRQKVAKALIQMKFDPVAQKMLESAMAKGFEQADDNSYKPVREFLDEYDKAIGLPAIKARR